MAKRQGRRWLWLAAGLCALGVLVVVVIAIGVGASQGGAVAAEEQERPSNMASDLAAYGENDEDDDTSGESDGATEGAASGVNEQRVDEYVPNEMLVSVSDPAVLDELKPGTKIGDAVIKSVDVLSDGSDGETVVKITTEGGSSTEDTIDALNGMDGVAAQKNFIYRLM